MILQLLTFEIALLTATVMAIGLARIAWLHRPIKGTMVFSGLMVSAGIWSIFYALELAVEDKQAKVLFAQIQYIGIVTIPYLWIIFTLQYTRQFSGRIMPKLIVYGLLVEPVITLILVFSNGFHGLVWREIDWRIFSNHNIAVFDKGMWYWINILYSYLLLLSGTAYICRYLFRHRQDSRPQAVSLLMVVLTPWLGNVLYVTRLSPIPYLDFTPFGFVIAGFSLILGVYKFNLFNIIPIARDLIIESIADAVIVLDNQGRVVDLNISASRITRSRREEIIGKRGAELFPMVPEIQTCHGQPTSITSELILHSGALLTDITDDPHPNITPSQYYELTLNPIFTQRNRHIGHLIILRDVTTQMKMHKVLATQQHGLENKVGDHRTELTQTNTKLSHDIKEEQRTELSLEQRVEELQVLFDCGQLVSATLSLDHVIQAALETALAALGSDMVVLYLVKDNKLHLNGGLSKEKDQNIDLPDCKELGGSLCGKAAATGQPFYVKNILTHPYCVRDEHKNAGFQSFAALPLKHKSSILGVLGLATFHEHDFDKHNAFLMAFSSQIASAIHNAMIHSQIQNQVADMAIEVMERNQTEKTLTEHLDQMEDMVNIRTAKLNEANTRLREEISKRKQSAIALEQSESLHQHLVETSPDAITLTDLEGYIITTNLQAARMHGFSNTDQAIGLNAFTMLSTDYQSTLPQRLQQLQEEGSMHGLECEISRNDGTTYPVEISVSVISNLDGEPTGYMAVYRDITERKLAQQLLQSAHHDLEIRVQQRTAELQALNQALRESERKLVEAHELAQLGNWEWDIITNRMVFSDESCRIYGLSQSIFPLNFEALLNLVHPDDRERVEKETNDALCNDEKTYKLEYRITKPDGELRVVNSQAVITRDTDGNPIKMSGMTQDVTSRNMVELALKRQNEELSALNSVAATISRELDLPRALRVILGIILEVSHLHSAWILLMGDEGNLSLMAVENLPEDAIWVFTEAFAEDISSVLTTRVASSRDLNTPGLSPMGTYRNMSLVLVPIQARDAVLGIFGALCISGQFTEAENISLLTAVGNQIGMAVENTRLLNQAAQVELLKELDRLRSELIANVSHELRTPLGLITLFSSNLLLEEIDLPKEKQLEFLQGIKEEAEHLERIVDDLLNLGRIEGGKLHLNQQPTDLQQIAQSVASAMRIELGRRRLKREFLSKPLVANLDKKRIEQVIRNLLGNAIKYSPDGSVITISGYQDAEELGICISDQGIGIPKYEQDLIFQRFYRIDNDITRRTRGTGLGLAISKAIVEAHGGRIWVDSSPGEGSSFCISFSALVQRAVLTISHE